MTGYNNPLDWTARTCGQSAFVFVANKVMMKKVILFFSLLVLAAFAGDSLADQLRDGDIIFHTSR